MSTETLLIWLLIGAVAGWLAGVIVKGGGFGLVGNIVVGIIGSFIGGWLFANLHIATGGGIFGEIIGATAGAVVLLFLLRVIRRTA
ncbi:MAG: GlsB/YeaQ/YmgE family stress response membrane protein [Pseudomonadota bacterium]